MSDAQSNGEIQSGTYCVYSMFQRSGSYTITQGPHLTQMPKSHPVSSPALRK